MKGLKKAVAVFLRVLDAAQLTALFVSAVGFSLICFAQVIARYVVNNSIIWADQACRYLFCVSTFLGAAICVKERKHTSIDFLAEVLPPRGKKVQTIVIYAIIAVFGIILVRSGYALAIKAMRQKVSTMPLKMGQIYMMVPISAAFITLNAIRVVAAEIAGFRKGDAQ